MALQYAEENRTLMLTTAALSALALTSRTAGEVAANLLALTGPLALFFAMDYYATHPRLKRRAMALREMNVAVFASTAAGLAGYSFAWVDLLFLNASGAFLNALLLMLVRNHESLYDEPLATLDIFRETFCGVWTSFVGMVVMAGTHEGDIGMGVAYFAATMAAGVVAHEAGLRLGGHLNETVLADEPKALPQATKWLPYMCAYLSTASLLKAASLQMVASMSYSYLGCAFGGVLPESRWPVLNDFVANSFAVLLVVTTSTYCRVATVRRGPAALVVKACASVGTTELENSFAGAVSNFCSSAQVAHSFLLSLVPEDVKDDLYYDSSTIGGNSMRELEVEIDARKSGTPKYTVRLGLRILAELAFVFVVYAVGKIVQT